MAMKRNMKMVIRTCLILTVTLLLTGCGETKTRKEINRRKAELKLHQETELKRAQEELWLTDSLLQQANAELEALQKQVEADKSALKATAEELTLLTNTRIRRDSIRTQYEALGMKIRYIRKKQKELESEASKVEKLK
jgi:PBP1b-binding outer membrane lipoprotein LpoB